jgi:hypothetical protein
MQKQKNPREKTIIKKIISKNKEASVFMSDPIKTEKPAAHNGRKII